MPSSLLWKSLTLCCHLVRGAHLRENALWGLPGVLSPEICSEGPGCMCDRQIFSESHVVPRGRILCLESGSTSRPSCATWGGGRGSHSSPLTHCFLGDKTKMPRSPSTRTSIRAQGQPGLTGKPKWFLVFHDNFLAHLHFKIVTDLEN